MKELIPYLIAAFTTLLAYIFHLRAKNTKLQSKVGEVKAESDLREVLTRKEIAKDEADKSEAEYVNTRNKYLAEHGDGAGEDEM